MLIWVFAVGFNHCKIGCKDRIQIRIKQAAVFFNIRLDAFLLFTVCDVNSHLLREEDLRAVAPQKQLSAVHPCAGEIADEGLSIGIQSKDQNDPTSLIFAQEASCSTTNHKHRHSFSVSFHVNTCTVSGVSFYIDLAAAHGISCRVADVSMNDDGTTVHGIANGILRISGDLDSRTVQIGSQCIPRDARN